MALIEADKQKVHDELLNTKQRLLEVEDSKSTLSTQVQQLKEQLSKFEHSHHMKNPSFGSIGIDSLHKSSSPYKCCTEYDNFPSSTNEVVRAIEKYEKQKESLLESNQVKYLINLKHLLYKYPYIIRLLRNLLMKKRLRNIK